MLHHGFLLLNMLFSCQLGRGAPSSGGSLVWSPRA